MGYLVLARKYRPRTFDEVVGQDHVVRTLKNAIATGRIPHAFLFVGPRGIGKTSTARILAKALNAPGPAPSPDFNPDDPLCVEIAEGRSMDVLEIDGASNNNVEQVRELRDNAAYAPATGRFKIYLIDEVHMLSPAAFNALLKTLEEPPAHVKFIFATTEPHKILPTILSRCQRFDLRRITDRDISRQLAFIAQQEGINASPGALAILARNAEGGLRDAESAFDQLISFCGTTITEADVLQVFGLTGHQEVWDIAGSLLAGDAARALQQTRELIDRGKDLSRLTQELLRFFRNLLVFSVSPGIARAELDETELRYFEALQPLPPRELLLSFLEELAQLEEKIRYALVKEVLFEIYLLRLTQHREKVSLEQIILTLTGGQPAPSPASVLPSRPPPASPPATATPTAPPPAVTPAAAPTPPPAPDKPVSQKEFEDDPLIQEAMRAFDARLVDIKPGP